MCGGSKGQSQSNTSQAQTYTPNPQAMGAISGALNQAQNTAQLPFNMPQAPVAGFSPQQQQAFGLVGQAQGQAQPYFNQAQNLFNQSAQGPDISQFFNPYAGAVTAQMNNIFGQQQSQNNANLVQSAGGVGADRIAVGQGNLANQQGLAAGQTLAGLYAPSLSAAQQQQNIQQSAAYGIGSLGSAAQNASLSGANALLGTGGLQQQLSQAQLNSPYQQQLAQAMFPYQQSNFLTNAVASLAPGLGGTTSGQGQSTSTPAQPSIWSQLLGAGTAGAGLFGAFGGFGGSPSFGGGNLFSGDAWGGNSANPLPGLSASDYGAGFAGGGAANPYAFDFGGTVSDDPIDISKGIVPQGETAHIAPHIPQVNLTPPQQSQQQSGGGFGDILKTAASVLPFLLATGGGVSRENMKKFDGHNPYSFFEQKGYADGGAPDDVFNPDEPFRMPDADAVKAWRQGTDRDISEGQTKQDLPSIITGPAQAPMRAMSFAGTGSAAPATPAPADTPSSFPGAQPSEDASSSFARNPWTSLIAAGAGMMGGTSPFAGVNIGQGLGAGLKNVEQQRTDAQKDTTIAQAAKRLELEAKHHEDQYTRMTPYQKETIERQSRQDELAEERFNRPYNELTKQEQAQLEESRRQHDLARVPQGFREKTDESGNKSLEPIPGGPHSTDQIQAETQAKRGPAMADEDLRPMIDTYKAGNTAGVLASISRGTQGSQNIARFWHLLAEDLQKEGKGGKDLAAAKANFMAQAAGARTAAVREANIDTAVNEAKLTFPQVLQRSAELPRSDFPLVNKAIEAWRTNTGSPEQRRYGAAIQSAITAYSQAMSRTGANSVYAQQHAEQLLSKVDGPEALKGSIEQLEIEMGIAQRAPEETRQNILNRILGIKTEGGQQPAGTPGATSAAPAATPSVARPPSLPEGSQYSPSRKMWRTPDGKMFDATGQPVGP